MERDIGGKQGILMKRLLQKCSETALRPWEVPKRQKKDGRNCFRHKIRDVEKETGYDIPPMTPFVGENFNVTRAGIAYWVNEYLQKKDQPPVDKNHPLIQKINSWVQNQYDNGRVTMISDGELENLVEQNSELLMK